MTGLAYTRCGSGDPLVLLHGLGSSRAAWQPVLPLLADRFDVIAVDLPGFGESASLPSRTEPSPAALAAAVVECLTQLGLRAPHVVGNSLGGWVALELAAQHPAASLTLLSPAGLWRRRYTPWYCRITLRSSRLATRYLGSALRFVVRSRVGRFVVFAQTTGRPTRMSAEQARAAIDALGRCRGFRAALRATLRRRYEAGAVIDGPVTLVFGTRDRVLLKRQSRHLDQLPPQTVVVEMPGAGHIPMTDDPEAVAEVIAGTAARARSVELAG